MDIFDLSDISDLPPELVDQLNLLSHTDKKIIELFNVAGRPLNLTELLAAYYRKYKDVKSRQYMMTTCYRMKKKGILVSTKEKGGYRIKQQLEKKDG